MRSAALALLLASAAAAAGEPARLDAVTSVPNGAAAVRHARLIEFHAADYPAGQLHKAIEVEVPVRLEISAAGVVKEVRPAARNIEREWLELVRSAMLKARFEPARIGAQAVPSTVPFTYRFALARPPVPAPVDLAATATLRGEVLAGGQRVAVPGVDVVAQGLGVAATTDARGRYALDLPPGDHVVVVAAPGFMPMQERVQLAAGGAELTLYPRRVDVSDLQATVEGERIRTSPTQKTLVHEEMRNVPGSQADPVRVIENLPGLARAPFAGGQLIVRGARPQDTGAYIDGQKIPILYHLLNGPSVLSEDMVERIDFLPGGGDVFYGRALAGIVSVSSKRGDPDRVHGALAADLNKSSLFLQGPLGEKTQFSLGARRSYVNPIVAAMTTEAKQVTLPIYWDYQARGDHQLANGDRLSLVLFGSDDQYTVVGGQGVAGSVSRVNGLRIGFHRARITWERKLSDAWSISASPLAGWDLRKHEQEGAPGAFAGRQSEDERTFAWGLRSEAAWRTSGAWSLRVGTDILFDRVSYTLDQLYDAQLRSVGAPNAQQAVRHGVRHLGLFGEYVEVELRAGAFRLTPGLRLEQMHWSGKTFLLGEPRISARYQVTRSTTLHAYAGLYHEPPQAQALDALLGNPNLTPERAEQYGIGATQRIADRWSLRVEGYVNRRSSLVFPAAAKARDDGTYENPLQLNSGIGHSVGFELLLRRELSARFYGWIAYTLSRSRERAAPGDPFVPTPFDQPHVLTALIGFRPSPQVEFAARLRLATGNPFAPVTSAAFDADSGSFVPRQHQFGADRLPTFVQLDFQINNIWSADTYALSLYLDFQNMMNRSNAEYLLYDYRFARAEAAHGLPFMAAVGARLSF